MHTISRIDLDNATSWVSMHVENPLVQTVILESLEQSKRVLYNTQLTLEDQDCALVFRSWGNEIFMSASDNSEDKRLKLAVAVRALASKRDEPKLWNYLSSFEDQDSFDDLMDRLKVEAPEPPEPPKPKLEVIIGGKK